MVLMMNSVEPTRSALGHHLVGALGVHQDLDAGHCVARSSSTTSAEKRPCTEQWPFHRIIRASRQRLGGEAAVGLARVPHDAVVEASSRA